MTRRYFPKFHRFAVVKLAPKSRTLQRHKDYVTKAKKGRNLRYEFDIIMRQKYTIVNDDELNRIWKVIGTEIINYPHLTLEEHIENFRHI